MAIDYGVDPLTVGPVAFAVEECPESFPLGVTGAVAKKVAVGGSTTTQKLGARTRDISWDGKFFENALTQHAALAALCRSQQTVPVTWNVSGVRKYNGVVVDYYAEFHDRNLADYHIALSLVEVPFGKAKFAGFNQSASGSVDSAVSTQSTAVASAYKQVTTIDSTAAAQLPNPADLNVQIESLGPIAQASGSTADVESYLNGAIAQVQKYAAAVSPLSSVQGPAGTMLSNLQLILGNVQAGRSTKSVLIDPAETNIFRVFAQQYGDPSLAFNATPAGKAFPFLQRGVTTSVALPPYATNA